MPVKPGRLHTLPRLIVSGKRVLGSSLAGSKAGGRFLWGSGLAWFPGQTLRARPQHFGCRTESTEISLQNFANENGATSLQNL